MKNTKILLVLISSFVFLSCESKQFEKHETLNDPIFTFNFSAPVNAEKSDFDDLSHIDQLRLIQSHTMEVLDLIDEAGSANEAGQMIHEWSKAENSSELPLYLREQIGALYLLNFENKAALDIEYVALFTQKLARSGSTELGLIYDGFENLVNYGLEEEALSVAQLVYLNNKAKMDKAECFNCMPERLRGVVSEAEFARQFEGSSANRDAFVKFEQFISSNE
ncbi:MAG: hypothetical protein LAT84_12270 [Balneolia bacterium]|nr:hypothetical protein [Balneolia bacterium]